MTTYKTIFFYFSLSADKILFNSKFNQESFLSSIKSFFKVQPDFRPKDLREQIELKCKVLYFPMDFQKIEKCAKVSNISEKPERAMGLTDDNILKIVWPHR